MLTKNKNRVLVFAAHPDDEVLGCGGSIAYHRSINDDVAVCYISEGVSARFDINKFNKKSAWEKDVIQREEMAKNAALILDFEILEFMRLPNLRMTNLSLLDIVKKISTVVENYKPNIVYVNFPGDLNTDHSLTFEAVYTALRPYTRHKVEKILCYEVLSSTDWAPNITPQKFVPDTFINISKMFDLKLKSVNEYEFEMRSPPHPRSLSVIKSLAIVRGAQVGVLMAEGFMTIRNVIS